MVELQSIQDPLVAGGSWLLHPNRQPTFAYPFSRDDRREGLVWLLLLLLGLGLGCSTHARRLAEPRSLFYEGNLDQAHERLAKLAQSHRRDQDVAQLDLAMVELMQGNPRKAEIRLREVRDRFDHLEQASITESATSLWLDDQVRSYAGEDYEKVCIRCFLALASLMQDGGDAEAYSLQINEKQHQLALAAEERLGSKVEEHYAPVPMGYYLKGLLREASFHDYTEAAKAYRRVSELIPGNPIFQWDIDRAEHSVHSQPGMGVLYVFAMVGQGPIKVEREEQATSDALLIADRIVSAIGNYSVPPTLAPIKVPAIHVPSRRVDSIAVDIDQQPIGPTTLLTDFAFLAQESFEVKRREWMARAIARRVVKKASIYVAKDSMGTNGLTSLAMDAMGVLWEASESADTRCWGLLPREMQVLRVELPAGTHQLTLAPLWGGNIVGTDQHTTVNIIDGRNSYAICYYPEAVPIGSVRVSQ